MNGFLEKKLIIVINIFVYYNTTEIRIIMCETAAEFILADLKC